MCLTKTHNAGRPLSAVVASQDGAIVFLAAITSGVLILLAALGVDFSHFQAVGARLQTVADAAALASTNELVGNVSGWTNAKRASLAAIQANQLRGFSGDIGKLGEPDSVTGSLHDALELSGPYAANEFIVGNLAVKFERGLYYSSDGGCTYSFFEFETLNDLAAGNTTFDTVNPGPNCSAATPCVLFQVTNATRVTLALTVPTSFPKVTGLSSKVIARTAISARNYLVSPPPAACP